MLLGGSRCDSLDERELMEREALANGPTREEDIWSDEIEEKPKEKHRVALGLREREGGGGERTVGISNQGPLGEYQKP